MQNVVKTWSRCGKLRGKGGSLTATFSESKILQLFQLYFRGWRRGILPYLRGWRTPFWRRRVGEGRVGVFPGGEEGFVGFLRGGFVAGEGVGAGEAELRLGIVLDADEGVAFVL